MSADRPSPASPVDPAPALSYATLAGFVAVALVDGFATAQLGRPGVPRGVRLEQLAYAAGHVLAVGLALVAVAFAAKKALPARRGAAPAAAVVAAFVLGWGVFVDDFAPFPTPLRAALTLGAALPFGLLVALHQRRPPRRLVALPMGVVALGLVGVNQHGLDSSYPGVHLTTTALAGLVAGLAVRWARRPSAERSAGSSGSADGPSKLVRYGALGAVVALAVPAAITVIAWPRNAALVELLRQPTASLVPFLARIHAAAGGGSLASVPPEQRDWFLPRSRVAAIPPTTPPLAGDAKPLVVLLTIDALRYDILADRGLDQLKHLRALADRGASFSRARSTSASTSPSLATIFTGRYFSSLYWSELPDSGKLKFFLPKEETIRFPALLTEAGVHTVSITTAPGFVPEYGIVSGFKEVTPQVKWAAGAIPHVVKFLEETPADRSGFIFAHLLDPHAPYPHGKKGDPPRTRYLDSVRHVDEQLAKVVSAVERAGVADRATIIISADHGEAFGEHGTTFHASTVYEELIHVPLVIAGPGVKARVIDEPASTIDLGPTILDMLGVATPGTFLGQSLVPLLRGDDVRLSRPIIIDSGRRIQALIDRSGMKAIRDLRGGTVELYDLSKDPGELKNLAESQPDEVARRVQALSAFFGLHELRRDGYTIPYRQ